jgi:diguanylate cyclase (GGDEF)-like protein/PAS domain S-box-containing protein
MRRPFNDNQGDDDGGTPAQTANWDMSPAVSSQLERRLREAEARFQTLVEEMPAIIYINGWDEPHPMLYVSPHVEEMLGYPAANWLDQTGFVYQIVHPDDRERLRQENERTEAIGARFTMEYRLTARDGRVVWVRDECVPVYDTVGRPLFYQGIMIDVSDRHRAEEALRDSEERYRSAFDDAAIALGIATLDGRLLRVNAAHCELLGYRADELIGIDVRRLIHPADLSTTNDLRERLLAGTIRSYREERRYIHKDGHIVWGLVNLSITRDAEGNPLTVLAQVQDITDRKLAEEALRESEEYFRSTFDDAGIAMGVSDLNLRLLRVNRPLCEMLGYSEAELLAVEMSLLMHPDCWEAHERWRIDLLVGRTSIQQTERRFLHKEGHIVWGLVNLSLVHDSDGQPRYFLSQIQNITDRKRIEESLRESEELFRGAFAWSPVGITLSTPDGRYIRVNQAFCEMLGYSEAQMLDLTYEQITHLDDLIENRTYRQRLLDGEIDHFQIEKRYRHAAGHAVWALLSVAMVRDSQGEPLYVIGQAQDISDRKALEARLTHQAFHDSLTGLPNRALLHDRIEHALERARRNGETIAVIFMDLDGFKAVNDSWGHATGDELLIAIGQRLRGWVRAGDTVARLGGDEFTILLEDIHTLEEATRIADRIIAGLETPIRVDGRNLRVRASLGIAFNRPPDLAPNDLLRHADIALYRAKHAGGSQYTIYDEDGVLPHVGTGELRATYS